MHPPTSGERLREEVGGATVGQLGGFLDPAVAHLGSEAMIQPSEHDVSAERKMTGNE